MKNISVTATIALLACTVITTAVQAGGLAVREQSAQFQGSSFAGSGAGGGISSTFWNSAAIADFTGHRVTEQNAAVIFGDVKITGSTNAPVGGSNSADFDDPALLSSGYNALRINDRLVIGMGTNSPFGLATEPNPQSWNGRFHHYDAKLLSLNANPVASYEVMPGLYFGIGAQIQYVDLNFQTRARVGLSETTFRLRGDDVGFGLTAGVLYKPMPGTSIGLGFRSAINHRVKGDAELFGIPRSSRFQIDITTPEMVNLSLRQSLSPRMRLLATAEWTNWSRLGVIPITGVEPVIGTGADFDFQYDDGWYFAIGAEYDVNAKLTVRSGVSYEISPVQNASQRLLQVTDSDRIWLSAGATYKWNANLSFDVGYSHIFFDDAPIERNTATNSGLIYTGEADQSANIFALSVKYKWGATTSYK